MMSDTGVYTCHLHYRHRPDANPKLRSNLTVHVLQGGLENTITIIIIIQYSYYLNLISFKNKLPQIEFWL